MYWYMTCRYYGEQIYGIPHQVGRCIGQVVGSTGGYQVYTSVTTYGVQALPVLLGMVGIYGILAWWGVRYYSSSTLLGTTCTYYTALPVWRHHITYYYIQLLGGTTLYTYQQYCTLQYNTSSVIALHIHQSYQLSTTRGHLILTYHYLPIYSNTLLLSICYYYTPSIAIHTTIYQIYYTRYTYTYHICYTTCTR